MTPIVTAAAGGGFQLVFPTAQTMLAFMRTGCRIAALGAVVVTLALWFFGGPNFGWTKTRVPVTVKDELTGLEGVNWEKRFLPGLDFLGAGLAAGLVLWTAGFAFRKPASSASGSSTG